MTAPAVGSNTNVVVGPETVYGTIAVAGSGKKVGVLKCGLKGSRKTIENTQVSADPNLRDQTISREDASGPVTVHADITSAPWWLKRGFGSLATTGPTNTTDYTHVAKIQPGKLPSFSLEQDFLMDDGTTHLFSQSLGCIVESTKFDFKSDGFLDLEMGVAASCTTKATVGNFTAPTDWTAQTPLDNSMILAADIKFGAYGALGVVDDIVDGSITITNRLNKDDYRPGSLKRSSITRGKTEVKVNLTFMFDSAAVWDLIRVAPLAPVALQVTFTQAVGSPGGAKSMKINVPRIYVSKIDPCIEGDGPITLKVEGTAAYDSGTTSSCDITVINQSLGTVY
jgi:hypothetical protein